MFGPLVSRMRLLARNRLVIAVLVVSAVVAAMCAKYNTRGNLMVGAATAHMLVDDPDASIVDRTALTQDVSTLQKRAELYAHLLTTQPVLDAVAKRAGLPPGQLSGIARLTENVPIPLTQPGSEERASQIAGSRAPYRLELQPSPGEPILAIYAEAPSFDEAQRLADAVMPGLQDYLHGVARQDRFPVRELPRLELLGSARGGIVNGHARYTIGGLTFITAFGLCFVALLFIGRRIWPKREPEAPPPRAALTGRALADWPRTTRMLPWSIAGLIAMFWLSPFDKVQLAVHTPVNITLDRMLLPIVAVIWLIALTAGPGAAPRIRITRVHLALGAFVACAFISVVLDARTLNQTSELALSIKKVPLLVSYASIFVLVASSVRRSEVPAFMTFSLVLAVIMGVELIYERHISHNLFIDWWSKLPSPFELTADTTGSAFDSQGRRWIVGPAGSGVEAITMLSMMLPVAVFGVLNGTTRGRKAFYGFAIAVFFAASFSTERKSAMIAPAAVMLTLLYFRRKELLSLAPLGLVIMVMVAAASPSAIHGVLNQFLRPDSSHVATVSDRTSDYDAIRPDLWTHLAFGRGFGSYDHNAYRILDSEILSRAVETGLLGLAAYLMIGLSVILIARKTVAERHPSWSLPALWGVASAVCLIVVSALYDVMAFPHGTCEFLYIAGLVVAVVKPGVETPVPPRRVRRHAVRVRAPRPVLPAREPVGTP